MDPNVTEATYKYEISKLTFLYPIFKHYSENYAPIPCPNCIFKTKFGLMKVIQVREVWAMKPYINN